ncbi:hypothetical protein [Lacticaseibacillus camelliae]|uniref:Uncharacterized protein n=1 Tax=Lacticaseibacillus camelliae DSM 22697 = JCM 13995 TaxID=1423730 RepID=A0A0R2FJR4_9LACO|nr:hypothetical protein [Lacticaseibacillus camelliae]KRN25351.1 hypothetical protein FC75_GL000621 [Lacticaseibacillus camelliae DSM 22697 = JCM 13995]
MRSASVLAEHLGALIVTAVIVGWLTLLARQYQVQVAPVAQAVAVRYAARTALAAHPGTGKTTIWLGKNAYAVTITDSGVEVQKADGQKFWFSFRDDAR